MKLSVIGTGYVGLVTGSVFSDLGNDVVCVDTDCEKVRMLERGEMPIYEPGLAEMVRRNMRLNRLTFTSDVQGAVRCSDVVFICVGTPPLPNGEPDMRFVEEVASSIGSALNEYKLIVNKSTVPVGTGDLVRRIIEERRASDIPFDVLSNPEFLREGSAIQDTLEPDRIVIGAPNHHVAMQILELYAPLERPMLITDVASAEMIKYASNAFLATKISFINSIAAVCDAAGADVEQVAKGMGADRRIGSAFLSAGLGYGGSCFPKDTSALVRTAEKHGVEFGILKEAIAVNHRQPQLFLDRLERALGGSFAGKRIGLLGLAFKPNTDDLRDAMSLEILARLLAGGADVAAYDPIAMENTRKIMPSVDYASDSYGVAEDADALIVVTEWNEFKQLDMERICRLMRTPLVFDGRNIYDPDTMIRLGFTYYGIGRAAASANCKHLEMQAA